MPRGASSAASDPAGAAAACKPADRDAAAGKTARLRWRPAVRSQRLSAAGRRSEHVFCNTAA